MHLYYTPDTQRLNVLIEASASSAIPTTEAENVYTPLANCPTILTQLGIADADNIANTYNGMSYVMRLSDGSFVVIDGGHNTPENADYIYKLIKKQAKTENPVIAAWIFTHAHGDHVLTFPIFAQKYGNEIDVERFIYNFLSSSRYSGTEGTEGHEATVYFTIDTYYPEAAVTIAHAGQRFYIRNAVVDILYAAELYTPELIADYNSGSLVFTIEADGVKSFFFGDAYKDVGDIMTAIYDETVFKSDVMQVSHHGIYTTPSDLYPIIAPSYVLWPLTTEYGGNAYDYNNRDYVNQSQNNYFKTYTKDTNLWMSDDDIVLLTFRNGEVSAEKHEDISVYLGLNS